MPDRTYWDSCVFIDLLQQTPDRIEACEELHRRAVANEIIVVTSVFTLVEVCHLPKSGLSPREQREKIVTFFENPYIVVRQLDRIIALRASEITQDHGLTNADAIHVATALEMKAAVMYTYDAPKKKRRGLLGQNGKIGNPPLRIEIPPKPSLGPLYDKRPEAEGESTSETEKTEKQEDETAE